MRKIVYNVGKSRGIYVKMGKQVGNKKKKSDKSLFKYIPVYPKAPMDMKYHYYDDGVLKVNPNLFELVTDLGRLEEIFKGWEGKKVAIDTETTGLTFFKDFMVGFSVSVDKDFGIYVPLRHQIKRVDEVEEDLVDENGNVLYTKRGKKRTKKVKHETFFEHPANVNVKGALDLLWDLMKKSPLCIFFNLEFDATMFKNEGYDLIKEESIKLFDASILTYLFDAENKNWNNLKACSEIVLGRKPTKFEEALGGAGNFRYVDLDQGYPYAGSDSACTIGIYEQLGPKVRELLAKTKPIVIDGATKPYSVYHRDNELIQAFTDYYHHVDLCVDTEAAKRYKAKAEKELADAENKIYEYFDMGNFNLSPSSKAFQDAMKAKNIDTGLLTDTGNVSYGKKGIEVMSRKLKAVKEILRGFKYIEFDGNKLNKRASLNDFKLIEFITSYGKDVFKFKESTNYLLNLRTIEGVKMDKRELFEELKLLYKRENKKLEILKTIQKRSSLAKAVNSYIEKLTQVDTCHMHYNLKGTASGRLSSGNGSKTDKKKNHYFIDLNAQNLTKPHSAFYKAYRSDEEGNILGWKFEMVTEEYMHEHKDTEIIVEGSDPENNIRNCIVAPAGRYIASLDYSAQEYRAIAILSKDHKMLDNFKRGIDPHTATAYAIWGEENYDRQKRKKAKAANFLQSYCGGPKTLAENLDIPIEDAKEIMEKYEKAFFECINWKKKIQKFVIEKNDGVAFSIFGRPRQFKSVLSTSFRLKSGTKEFQSIPEKDRIYKGDAIYKAVERKIVSHAVQGCLQGDTRVLTNHGYIKIKDLYDMCQREELDESWLVYTGSKWADFTVLNMGKAKKARLVTKGGNVLYCDDRHEVFCHTGSIAKEPEAKHRKVTSLRSRKTQICVMKPTEIDFPKVLPEYWMSHPKTGNARVITISEEDHERLWYWMGYWMGDGSWAGFCSDYKNYYQRTIVYAFGRHELDNHVKDCMEWFKKFGLNPKCTIAKNEKGHSVRVAIHSAGFVEFMTDVLGIPLGCHFDTKRVPDILFRSPLAHRKAFIDGLMDSDGYKKEGKIHLHNFNLLNDTKRLCTISGIPTRLHLPENRKCDTTCLVLGGKYGVIGPKGLCKVRSLGKDPRYDARSFSKLEVSDELVDTYTLSVLDEEHRFVSDDIISKNCCGDICRWDLIRLYRRFFKNRDPHIDFYTTVHDEINFTIDKDCVVDYVREIDDIMTIHNLSKELPIETSIDLGYTLGVLFPFEWEDETRTNLVPARV